MNSVAWAPKHAMPLTPSIVGTGSQETCFVLTSHDQASLFHNVSQDAHLNTEIVCSAKRGRLTHPSIAKPFHSLTTRTNVALALCYPSSSKYV